MNSLARYTSVFEGWQKREVVLRWPGHNNVRLKGIYSIVINRESVYVLLSYSLRTSGRE